MTDMQDSPLRFDASACASVSITVDGVPMKVRQYRVVYVARPIRMATTQAALGGTRLTLADPFACQSMIISVPEASVADPGTALYVVVDNSGWWASPVSTPITEGQAFASTTDTDHIGAALKAGYVVVNVGTRGRGGARTEDGRWAGKAPAAVVDAKAAIRYLRLNDGRMPGSAERIVMTGTSGGGGLTAVVSASGNSADHLPDLADIGAAGVTGSGPGATSTIRDDIFAAVAYCPVQNLGNADAGYEWEYHAVRTDANTPMLNDVAYSAGPQASASAALAAAFPAYVDSLGLKLEDGRPLTDARLRDATIAHLKAEIERQIAAGTAVPALGENFTVVQRGVTSSVVNDWLTLSGSGPGATVASIDYPRFLKFVTTPIQLKTVVAFDSVGVTDNRHPTTGAWHISGESDLFGSEAVRYANFTEWSWTHRAVKDDGSGLDAPGLSWADHLASPTHALARQLRLINPLAYLNTGTDTAPHWYVRHGMIDRDTAFSMQTLLQQAIRSDPSVKTLDFRLNYLTGHSGHYDVQEAFAWIQARLAANP